MARRLDKVALELNVGTDTIVTYLKAKGFSIRNRLTARITYKMYSLLSEKKSLLVSKEKAQKNINDFDDNYYKYKDVFEALRKKSKEIEKVSIKSLKNKVNIVSGSIDLETVNMVDDLESQLNFDLQLNTDIEEIFQECCKKHYSIIIQSEEGDKIVPENLASKAYYFANNNTSEASSEYEEFVKSLSVSEKKKFNDLLLKALEKRYKRLSSLTNKYRHLRNALNQLIKEITSKTRQFFYQITSLFLSVFHYFDLTHNDNINELNKR